MSSDSRRSYCARLIFDINAVRNAVGGSSESVGHVFFALHRQVQSVNRKVNCS